MSRHGECSRIEIGEDDYGKACDALFDCFVLFRCLRLPSFVIYVSVYGFFYSLFALTHVVCSCLILIDMSPNVNRDKMETC